MTTVPKTITADEAVRNISDVLDRVQNAGETFDVIRGDSVVAQIAPPSPRPKRLTLGELHEAMKSWPKLDPDDAEDWVREIEEMRR
jgi:antitoxin (DNA-binding transcriptional repressor) of toxin-antitoxin stability system